jgi:hypothetical protein
MITGNDAGSRPAQRVEVFTGAGRRRNWLHEEKVRIVAEIASNGNSVCEVARRHGLSPQQLFGAGPKPCALAVHRPLLFERMSPIVSQLTSALPGAYYALNAED